MSASSHTKSPHHKKKVVGHTSDDVRYVTLNVDTGIDPDRVVLTKIKKTEKTVNKVKETTYSSDFAYIDDEGKACRPITLWGEQVCYTNATYPFKSDPNTHNPETVDGYQMGYPMCKDIDDMNDCEEFVEKSADAFFMKTFNFLGENLDSLAAVRRARMTWTAARDENNPSVAIKPLFIHRNVSETDKTPDLSRPTMMYIKFSTFVPKNKDGSKGSGRNLKCFTKIYGPGDREMSPAQIAKKAGKTIPAIEWLGVTWVPANTEKVAIIKYKLIEITWKPAASSGPSRVTPVNNAPIEEENGNVSGDDAPSEGDDGDDGEQGDFDNPFAIKSSDPLRSVETNNANYDKAENSPKSSSSHALPPEGSASSTGEYENDEVPQADTPKASAAKSARDSRRAEALRKKRG